MNFEEYQEKAARSAKKLPREEVLKQRLIGLYDEGGELAGVLKRYLYHGHSMSTNKLIDEAGDVLWYLTMILDALDISLDTVAKLNISKLNQRYPNGFYERWTHANDPP